VGISICRRRTSNSGKLMGRFAPRWCGFPWSGLAAQTIFHCI